MLSGLCFFSMSQSNLIYLLPIIYKLKVDKTNTCCYVCLHSFTQPPPTSHIKLLYLAFHRLTILIYLYILSTISTERALSRSLPC